MIKFRIFRWGDGPGVSRRAPRDHKGAYRNRDRTIRGREGDVMTEADVREEREIWRCSTVSFEDGGKECRKPVSFRSRRLFFPAKKMDSPLNLWK